MSRYHAYDYDSWEMGLLSAMERGQRRPGIAGIILDVHTQPVFERTPVDWVPGHRWNR